MALAGLLIAIYGTPLNDAMRVPADWLSAIRQVMIFGLLGIDGETHPTRLVPPAWSLNMELAWYLAMIVLVRFVGPWLLASCVLVALMIARSDWLAAYFTYWGPAFCFALGAAVWHYRIKFNRRHIAPAMALLVGVMALGNQAAGQVWLLYLASLSTAYVLASADVKIAAFKAADDWLGKPAYPVFLCHWAVASLIGLPKGWPLLLVSLPFIIVASWALVILVEHPVARLRDRVRPGGEAQPIRAPVF